MLKTQDSCKNGYCWLRFCTEDGKVSDLSPKPTYDIIPAYIWFKGRGESLYKIQEAIKNRETHKMLIITGEKHVGKSAVLQFIANMNSQRKTFKDGVIMISDFNSF